MDPSKKKIRGKGSQGKAPGSGENSYVISYEDVRAYQGEIVAVAGFPVLGEYAKVIAHADTVEVLRKYLHVLGAFDNSQEQRNTVTVHIIPGLDVCCYVNAAKSEPQIIRKEKGEKASCSK